MSLPKDENPRSHPFIKPPRNASISNDIDGRRISIAYSVSECEIRATNYISSLLGTTQQVDTSMNSDIESRSKLDATFISLGSFYSNYKTEDMLNATENIFVCVNSGLETSSILESNCPIQWSGNNFKLMSGESFYINSECDYGLILRITPTEQPDNAWLICAGIGEWGTSGASWYLANRWKGLIQKLGTWKYRSGMFPIPDFAVIVEVKKGQDESARIIKMYKRQDNQAVEVDVLQG